MPILGENFTIFPSFYFHSMLAFIFIIYGLKLMVKKKKDVGSSHKKAFCTHNYNYTCTALQLKTNSHVWHLKLSQKKYRWFSKIWKLTLSKCAQTNNAGRNRKTRMRGGNCLPPSTRTSTELSSGFSDRNFEHIHTTHDKGSRNITIPTGICTFATAPDRF